MGSARGRAQSDEMPGASEMRDGGTRDDGTAEASGMQGGGKGAPGAPQSIGQLQGIERPQAVSWVANSIGLATWYLCSNWVSTLTYDASIAHWWLNRSGAEVLAIIALAVLMARRGSLPSCRAADWAAAGLYAASIAALAAPGAPLAVATAALAGFGFAQIWMMARWSERLAALSAPQLIGALLGALTLVAAAKVLLAFVPLAVGSALVALLPLLAAGMLVFHPSPCATPPDRIWLDRASLTRYLPLAGAVAAFFLIWSILNFILKRETGHYGAGSAASPVLTVASQLFLVAFVLFAAWWVFLRKRRLDATVVWKLSYALTAVALFLFTVAGTAQAIQAVTGAAVVIAKMFLWVALIDAARHSVFPAGLVVCLGQLLYAVPDCLGRAAASLLSLNAVGPVAAASLLLVIVFAVSFLLPERSPAAMNLLSDTGQPAHAADEGKAIDNRCAELAATFGLSAREEDILGYLARGRSRPYIAETLYLSENTVRSHSKRIYQKLAVHTRQELLDLFSQESA